MGMTVSFVDATLDLERRPVRPSRAGTHSRFENYVVTL